VAIFVGITTILSAFLSFRSEVTAWGFYIIPAIVFLVFIVAIRSWNRPYVRITADRLIIYEQGREHDAIDRSEIVQVRRGLNKTILITSDGRSVPIGYMGFARSSDVQDFRSALDEIVRSNKS